MMLYVHVAEDPREPPEPVPAQSEVDPDKRIVAMAASEALRLQLLEL